MGHGVFRLWRPKDYRSYDIQTVGLRIIRDLSGSDMGDKKGMIGRIVHRILIKAVKSVSVPIPGKLKPTSGIGPVKSGKNPENLLTTSISNRDIDVVVLSISGLLEGVGLKTGPGCLRDIHIRLMTDKDVRG